MTPLPNDLTKQTGQPSFETLNNSPVANDTNQTIASVASTAISDEIPPLREPTSAPPKTIQFPHGYRPIVKDGIIVQIPNPAPPAKKTGIHTVHDLPPEEIPGLAELHETIQESKNLADKMEKFADDMEQLSVESQQLEADAKELDAGVKQLDAGLKQLGADLNQVDVDVQQMRAITQEMIVDTRQINADTLDMIQRVDKLIENSEERTTKTEAAIAKTEAETAKIIQQTDQLKALNLYLDQTLGNKTFASFISEKTAPIPVAEPNFLTRNWKIIGGGAFCLITLVAVAIIFGIVPMVLLSATLAIGTAFWKHCADRASSENFLLNLF